MGEMIFEKGVIRKTSPDTLGNSREEVEAFAAGLLSLCSKTQGGKPSEALHVIQAEDMSVEQIMIEGLLAQKNGRFLKPIAGVLHNLGSNVVPFQPRKRKR